MLCKLPGSGGGMARRAHTTTVPTMAPAKVRINARRFQLERPLSNNIVRAKEEPKKCSRIVERMIQKPRARTQAMPPAKKRPKKMVKNKTMNKMAICDLSSLK